MGGVEGSESIFEGPGVVFLFRLALGTELPVQTFRHIQKIAYTPPVGLVGKIAGESIKSPSSVWKATVAEGVDMSLVMAKTSSFERRRRCKVTE